MIRSADEKIVVTLHAQRTARVGESIPITLRMENKSSAPLELYLLGREPTYDFIVTASDGELVWRRLDGEIVPAILRVEVLEPGQVLKFRDTWDQRDNAGELVAPGFYVIRGAVLTDGSSNLESPATPLRITNAERGG